MNPTFNTGIGRNDLICWVTAQKSAPNPTSLAQRVAPF
jgi:hypothetical protein